MKGASFTKRPSLPGVAGRRLVDAILQVKPEKISWVRNRAASGECHFPDGLRLAGTFPKDDDKLDTARADFAEFQATQELCGEKTVFCRFHPEEKFAPEEHEIRVSAGEVLIRAGDIEGARRAIYWLEDEMLKRGGPFLPFGRHRRKAVIRTRISRCFFGPINRPPANRDELADDVDYYPDAYLSRLARDGVNVLWTTIKFRETVTSQLFPEFAPAAEVRLRKLRHTVDKCARYGIRLFVFCIEPDSLPVDSPLFVRHPELKGHVIDFRAAFCTSSALGREYLTEACRTLFAAVPGLGGLIVIPVGERFTHCYSIALPESGTTEERCNCRRCARRRPETVLGDTLSAMHRGMVAANPQAELIAWPYGQLIMWGRDKTVASAGHLPAGVILQHNFETGGTVRQLGKERRLWDYWLSVVGASPAFRESTQAAKAKGNRVSAKLQVGCSHEDATVPFVPVPGLLHAKYALLHRLGVSAVMQSWYFGNCPSLMTRAAGLLSFTPFIAGERAFLMSLAARDWGDASEKVVKAWTSFRRAYENYPATHLFGYYGPVQDGLVWPLHLVPRNRPLSPTWKLGYPPSGDYLADCLSSDFTLAEVVTLCGRMSRLWHQGLRHLDAAMARSQKTPGQLTQWRVAHAIALQFESAAEILRFYQLREKLSVSRGPGAMKTLGLMKELVQREKGRRRDMRELCRLEPTIGFHSEAEGFKITPALIEKGLSSLERLLKEEFPKVRRSISSGIPVFSRYTGNGVKKVLTIPRLSGPNSSPPWHSAKHVLVQGDTMEPPSIAGTDWLRGTPQSCPWTASFQASRKGESLCLAVRVGENGGGLPPRGRWVFSVVVDIEPRRLHPRIQFSGDSRGSRTALIDDGYLMNKPLAFGWRWHGDSDRWIAEMEIPLASARLASKATPFRFNLRVVSFNPETNERWELSWTRRSPLKPRQAWEDANPATDYGWAKFLPRASAVGSHSPRKRNENFYE